MFIIKILIILLFVFIYNKFIFTCLHLWFTESETIIIKLFKLTSKPYILK